MWKITRDHLHEELDEPDHPWPSEIERCSVTWDERNQYTMIEFRLYDDDGILYYEGVSSEEDFEPLDWGTYFAGCTYIQYKQPDKSWATL